ncbi:MAG: nuclear transport factor 2 family protein [Thermoleophilaceae bacterium]
MAARNSELVRQVYAALGRGDVESFLEVVDPDAVWYWPRGMADAAVYRGKDEMRRGLETWTEPWIDFRMEPAEVLERGEEVLVIARYTGRGRVSGVELDERVAHLWEFRDGLAVQVRMFGDEEKAKRRFTDG